MREALARLLLREPSVLLLHEPTSNVDSAAKAYLARYLREYPHTSWETQWRRPLPNRQGTSCCSSSVGGRQSARSRLEWSALS